MSRNARFAPLALAVLALPLGAGGCDDGGASVKQVNDLRAEVARIEEDRRQLSAKLDQAERRLSGQSEDIALLHKELAEMRGAKPRSAGASAGTAAGGAAADATTGASEGPASASPLGDAEVKALDTWFSSEGGRKTIDAALAAAEQRREEQRWNERINAMLDQFAQKAGLRADQTEAMRKISGRTAAEIRGIWSGMRNPDLTAEERTVQRQEAMAKMMDIQTRQDEEVKGILDASQFQMYQEETARMRGMMGGMGGPDRGMGGGRGGR